ncbi:hypothetical protein [Gimesia aquarii]|uniref:Uncharacterized protein n=1 Tax=Gimesia aquarii TaxID=2527964 RepID=A0A517VV19_9PLAN|nr:hypothetical protein [Gimesia aquarii]QDT96841.1 hypothetical protein V144x_22990 [Gimesia aquarii]
MSNPRLTKLFTYASAGLYTLLKAFEYAVDTERSEMEFSVEVFRLKELHLTDGDLRWLVCKEFAVHGIETTVPAHKQRQFILDDSLVFNKRSCLALTLSGYHETLDASLSSYDKPVDTIVTGDDPNKSQVTQEHSESKKILSFGTYQNIVPERSSESLKQMIPSWHSERRELYWNGTLIKRYKVPSPNQETVLTVFEEENWPVRIDDPLPLRDGVVPKRRLQDTIKSLNRNQRNSLIKFRGDGSGEGVMWEGLCPEMYPENNIL